MSMYRAHKPICEIRTPYQDSWGSVLWVSIDNYKEGVTEVAPSHLLDFKSWILKN